MPLSREDADVLAAVLDEIVPPSEDGRMPGAGEVGLVAHVEQAMEKSPELRPAIEQGLAALRAAAPDFRDRPGDARRDALNQLGAGQPAFLPALVFQTFTGYYQNGRVLEALGHEPRPPHPKGYALETGDLGLLDPVRQRGPCYRKP